MKTKLTLTVKQSIIESAKKRARDKGVSLSRMFEQIFEEGEINAIKTESQRAAQRLLEKLAAADSVDSKNDKQMIVAHVKRKFA